MMMWMRERSLSLLLVVLQSASCDIPVCGQDNVGDSPFCFPATYNKDLIPPTPSYLSVHVDTFIFEVSKIDDLSLTVTYELYMDLTWKETRIVINQTSNMWGPSDSFMGSTNFVKNMWLPDIQVQKCKKFTKREIVTDVAGLIIFKNKDVLYTISTEVIVACPMKFFAYPLDHQMCQFLIGSYIHDNTQITFTGSFNHDEHNQRAQQYQIKCVDLQHNDTLVSFANRTFSQTGFQVELVRRRLPILLQVYLTTGLFVLTSWVSFIVPPEVVPGRMSLLVTLFLVLVNIFNSVTATAPKSEGLTAVETWVISCIIHVFGVLAEYAIILKMIQNEKRRSQGRGQERLCLIKCDGETSLAGERGRLKQVEFDQDKLVTKKIQERVDVIAMYFFPGLFLCFNLCYWPYYLLL